MFPQAWLTLGTGVNNSDYTPPCFLGLLFIIKKQVIHGNSASGAQQLAMIMSNSHSLLSMDITMLGVQLCHLKSS